MNHSVSKILPLFCLTLLIGCGSDSSSSATEDSSSSLSPEEYSSSSYSNRLDAEYADTLSSDTLKFSEKNPVRASYKFFLGEYPKGTLIRIFSQKSSGGQADSFFVKEEKGEILIPEYTLVDANGNVNYNTQNLYARFGDSAFSSATFITTAESGFYYADIPNVSLSADSSFSLKIAAEIKKAYFGYIGDSSTISIEPGDTLHGVFFIGNGIEQAKAEFSASTGKSININVSGKSLTRIHLYKDSSEIAAGNSIDEQILPEKSADYTLGIFPQKFPDYTTGPYAYFDIKSSSRDLEQGEYFANPDSIQKIGDTLTVVRERNDAAKYYLRQEQYVWLADLEKDEETDIFHSIEGYQSGAGYPATYAVLNADGDSIATVSSTKTRFVAPKKGAYYLHYTRLNSPPTSESQVLTLKTVIQRRNYISRFQLFDEERETELNSKTVSLGDTLSLLNFGIRAEPADVSNLTYWYLPCEDLPFIRSAAYTKDNCLRYGSEQLWGATNIAISDNAENAGEIIRLIAESKADPTARDTLLIYIGEP